MPVRCETSHAGNHIFLLTRRSRHINFDIAAMVLGSYALKEMIYSLTSCDIYRNQDKSWDQMEDMHGW